MEKVFNNNNALWKVCILQGKNVFERQQRCVERPGRDQGESHCSGAEAATAVMQLLASASATINHSQPVPISTSFTLSQCQILNHYYSQPLPYTVNTHQHLQPLPTIAVMQLPDHHQPFLLSTIAVLNHCHICTVVAHDHPLPSNRVHAITLLVKR